MKREFLKKYIKEELATFREHKKERTYNPSFPLYLDLPYFPDERIQRFNDNIPHYRHDDYRGLLGVHVLKSEVGGDFAYRPFR